jgi:hypothetical protein
VVAFIWGLWLSLLLFDAYIGDLRNFRALLGIRSSGFFELLVR